LQLLPGLGDTLSVVRVDDEDDALGVLEVCGGIVGDEATRSSGMQTHSVATVA
jgi:hypothetical protein